MSERLQAAAARIACAEDGGAAGSPLRPDQQRVFGAFAAYLEDVASRSPGDAEMPFCRIILPPRTGKTVVAGHIIRRSGLTATFIVPTRALVDQTVAELRRQVPVAPVGTFCGERKDVVDGGINVITYAMMHGHVGALPEPLRTSALIIVDEAHHAMTPSRMGVLRDIFDPRAVRIALTATPDYSPRRRLERFFPELIHEITITEALALELLAPARVWVAEVDTDASAVSLVAGDYEQETLGRLMSTAPFFRAVELFRYQPGNAARPCLVACASRQQAHDLWRYLQAHRPPDQPAPRLLLGETAQDEREEALAGFEAGTVDTLVQVGVLVEGWSSQRCKLLLDLAPSMSRVRATQKYFRAMTPYEHREAHIYVLLPRRLPGTPVLPMDLFGGGRGVYRCGDIIGRPPAGGTEPIDRQPVSPIEDVRLVHRIVRTAQITRPALDPAAIGDVRAVLASCCELDEDRPCGVYRFRGLQFEHPLFTGSGGLLLEWLGVPPGRAGYHLFLARAFPDTAADRMLLDHREEFPDRSCAEQAAAFRRVLLQPARDGKPDPRFLSALRALAGAPADPEPSVEERLLARWSYRPLHRMVARLSPRERGLVEAYFGLADGQERTLAELAAGQGASRERIRQIISKALDRLHRWGRAAHQRGELRPDSRRREVDDRRARLAPLQPAWMYRREASIRPAKRRRSRANPWPLARFSGAVQPLLRRFSEELLAAAPERFREVHCTITYRIDEQGEGIGYYIRSPSCPDEYSEDPGAELHDIGFAIVDEWLAAEGAFPGFTMRCTRLGGDLAEVTVDLQDVDIDRQFREEQGG